MFKDDWITRLNQWQQQGIPCVMITVLEHRGSTPRNSGTRMLVADGECVASIGGGHLEYQAIALAREMLGSDPADSPGRIRIESFALGARLGQCCGGQATLSFEFIGEARYPLVIFGAGHVAKALVPIVSALPFAVTWIDQRADEFPTQLPPGVATRICEDPVGEIGELPDRAFYLIMTHNHQLDFELCDQLLRRNDVRYLGMIGSATKRKRFDYRLGQRDITPAQLARLHCPVGLADVPGKHPAEIAVAIAAELIACYHGLRSETPAMTDDVALAAPSHSD